MALPFVLGIALGAGAVVAFNRSDKIKESVNSLFDKSKDVACNSFEKSKETVADVKETISATAACIKEKKEQAQAAEKTVEPEEKVSTPKRTRKPKSKEE
ncbi:MAG: hypothetical protein GY932_13325 [Arcobacter sp.]|nr:hypothetical protein [Arcobacter sp.]